MVDLSTCEDDFSNCKPSKKLTGADIAGLVNPAGTRVSTDCSTLFLTNVTKSAGGQLPVLSLAKPETPELLQTFEEGKTHDGVTPTGAVPAWHMSFFDGYLYVPMEFGEGVTAFKGKQQVLGTSFRGSNSACLGPLSRTRLFETQSMSGAG